MTRGGRLLSLALGLAGLTGQALVRSRLEARQEQAGLVIASADQAGLAADVAVPTLALGAFRGLVVDYLWLRATSFRAQGRHYESRQVAEQICRLQPRLPQVWSFLAHDLAYNVTSAVEGPEARWRWIQNGIELLRDQGLRYNPGDPDLCFMLARIYQDKIGTTTDDHHRVFKALHADQVARLMGDATPEALAASPGLDALAKADPEARALLQRAAALGVDEGPVGLVALADAGAEQVAALAALPAWPRVLLAARRDALRAALGFDAARLLDVDRAHGPLDWRSCDAAAAYWAQVGLEGAERRRRWREASTLRRTLHTALKNAALRGRVERTAGGGVFLAPIPALIPRVERLMREAQEEAARVERELRPLAEAGALSPSDTERLDAAVVFQRNHLSSRESFAGEAVMVLAEYGLEQDARRLHARGQRDFPDSDMFRRSYDDFVTKVLARRFVDAGTHDSVVGMTQLLEGTWVSAFSAWAEGDDERFLGLAALAAASRRRWDAFVATQAALEQDPTRRLGLPPDRDLRLRALHVAARLLERPALERLAERLGTTPEKVLAGQVELPR